MVSKKESVEKITSNSIIMPLLIIVLVIVSFFAGTLWIKVRELKKSGETVKTAGSATTFKPDKKLKKPEIKFFVMSFCPYGNQAEAGLKPVAELLKDKVSWQPVYIVADKKKSCEDGCINSVYDEAKCQQLVDAKRVPDLATCKQYFPYNDEDTCLKEKCVDLKEGEFTSLHGDIEMKQDVRELCAWKLGDEQKWWNFVEKVNTNCNAQDADSCWEQQAKDAKLDAEKIKKCEQEQAKDLLTEQLKLTEQYSVAGSPTIVINETTYNGGRQPEDYKKALCVSFEKEPRECSKVLSETTQAPAAGNCN